MVFKELNSLTMIMIIVIDIPNSKICLIGERSIVIMVNCSHNLLSSYTYCFVYTRTKIFKSIPSTVKYFFARASDLRRIFPGRQKLQFFLDNFISHACIRPQAYGLFAVEHVRVIRVTKSELKTSSKTFMKKHLQGES